MRRFILVSLFSLLLSSTVRLQLSAAVSSGKCVDNGSTTDASAGPREIDPPRTKAWKNIGPAAPGVTAKIAVDPAGSGTLYVGSIGGGVRKSTDNGATWSTVNSGLSPTAVYSLAMDASGPNVVYAGVFSASTGIPGGVFKTTNGGATWTLLAQTAKTVQVSLTPDPHIPGVIFAGGLGGNINKSTDGGQTWTIVLKGTSLITSVVIDPFDSNVVYASTLAGSLKSNNGGASWSQMSSLTPKAVWGLVIDPTNDNVLYAATTIGMWKTVNAGTSWQAEGALTPVLFLPVVDPSTHAVFVTSTEGVWESSDSGATWQPTGLTGKVVVSITIGPGSVLYAGTTSGPEISRDLGATWTTPDPLEGDAQAFGYSITVDPKFGRKLFTSTLGSTAFVSNDRGRSWLPVGTTYTAREGRKITVDPTDSNRVYSGSFYSGLFKSSDGGATWSRRTFGSGHSYVWIPVVDPVSPNIVYAGTSGEGLFKSEDYGDTWTGVPGLPALVQGITVDPRNDDEVFASTSGGVFQSHDAGRTWSNVLNIASWNVTIVGGGSQIVYATTKTAGVYKSLDGGSTWNAINSGITDLVMGRAAPVIVDPDDPQVLYVGAEGGGGVFRSTDAGAIWSAINEGLFDTSVFGLAADPHRSGALYVSGPHGVFATTLADQ